MIRSFVAVELPPTTQKALEVQITRLKDHIPDGIVRWVQASAVHLTLKFLGEIPEDEVGQYRDALDAHLRLLHPFEVVVRDFGCFPNRAKPRILWVGMGAPSQSMLPLQQAVEAVFAGFGYQPEARPFHAHLTLGRVHKRASRSEIMKLAADLDGYEIGELDRFSVNQISLMRSDLRPEGARYSQLFAVGLGGG